MGVLTTRLHGSITAIVAIATASASTELPDKSCMRAVCNVTGQTLLLSSVYAPAASSSFDFDVPLSPSRYPTLPSVHSSSFSSAGWPANIPPFSYALPANVAVPPSQSFSSQAASIEFHRATPPSSRCSNWESYLLHSGVNHFNLSDHSMMRFSALSWRCSQSFCECHPLLTLNCYSRAERPWSLWNRSPDGLRHLSSWRRPDAPLCCKSCIFSLKEPDGRTTIPGLLKGSRFEHLISSLYGLYAFPPAVSTKLLHTWHTPTVEFSGCQSGNGGNHSGKRKPTVVVVLLGWLGAEQRHLKKYSDWYTSRGIHAVTFVVPMKDLLTLKAGDKAEKHVDILTDHLVQWLKEESKQSSEKFLIFHTFSNTGWLIYGAILERLLQQGGEFLGKIKGCVVDSAPSAKPDPQVWASGFSAALLKKGSVATQKIQLSADYPENKSVMQPQPTLKETMLHGMLERFFSVFLQMPYVTRRLNNVISVLSNQQPSYPQLYIYSSADTVIPAKSVEAFIEEQRKAGRPVSACNFQHSPHVDHFRTFPSRYSDQLTGFLKLCLPQWVSQ